MPNHPPLHHKEREETDTSTQRMPKLLVTSPFDAGQSALSTPFDITYILYLLQVKNVRLPETTLLQVDERTKDTVSSLCGDVWCLPFSSCPSGPRENRTSGPSIVRGAHVVGSGHGAVSRGDATAKAEVLKCRRDSLQRYLFLCSGERIDEAVESLPP